MNDRRTYKRKRTCACGHPVSCHIIYSPNARNAYGSRYVCAKDGCGMWMHCDIPDDDTMTRPAADAHPHVIREAKG